MKKLLAFLCALTLLLSLGVSAFALTLEDQTSGKTYTQTIMMETPPLTWTLEIPSDCHIGFLDKSDVPMGTVRISEPSWNSLPSNQYIYVTIETDFRLYDTTKNNWISFVLSNYFYQYRPGYDPIYSSKYPDSGECVAYYNSERDMLWSELYVQVFEAAWEKVLPGTQYTATITYSSQYGSKPS